MALQEIEAFRREVILALFADNTLLQQLVLKGGNLLDIVYGISTRPSRDIDFSICGDIEDQAKFRSTVENALRRWFEPKGLVVFDVNLVEEPHTITEEFRDFWGGYKIDFKIIDVDTYEKYAGDEHKLRVAARTVVDKDGKRFPIEVSKHEYVADKTTEIIDDMTVYVYSPQMLVAEKLRALCQQTPEYSRFLKKHASPRGRDFLDIYTVAEHFRVDFGDPSFHQILEKTFLAKRVDLRLLSKMGDAETREFHRPDFVSIAPTIRPGFELQGYEFYYDYVVEKCRLLEPLWNI